MISSKLRTLLSRPQLLEISAHEQWLRDSVIDRAIAEWERPQMVIEHGVASIPVKGLLGRNLEAMDLYWGATDYNEIIQETREAEAAGVSYIVYEFDTFGGIATGVAETARAIESAGVPTVAFVNDYAFSAGYWLAASCDLIISMESAEVGSIGVHSGPYIDMSRALASEGIDVFWPQSGEHKAVGRGGLVPITDSQKALIQDRVDELGEEFRQHVGTRRSGISRDDMEGQTYTGVAGLSRGFTDVTIADKDELWQTIQRILG